MLAARWSSCFASALGVSSSEDGFVGAIASIRSVLSGTNGCDTDYVNDRVQR
jgi:hypothetical protein